jgi:hypothetical protein
MSWEEALNPFYIPRAHAPGPNDVGKPIPYDRLDVWNDSSGLFTPGWVWLRGVKVVKVIQVERATEKGVKNLSKAEDFFKGTKYSDKVLGDFKRWDNHSFSELVKNFAKDGKIQDIKWRDENMYQKLNIEWSYKWQNGTFEFIKDKNWVINHYFFNPSK